MVDNTITIYSISTGGNSIIFKMPVNLIYSNSFPIQISTDGKFLFY